MSIFQSINPFIFSYLERIEKEVGFLIWAVKNSQKNPLFVFQELAYLLAFLILGLFLTSLGKKILNRFKLHFVEVEELLFSFGLGIIAWANLILFLGIFSLFYSWLIWVIASILFIFCKKEMVKIIRMIKRIWKPGKIKNWGIEKKIFIILLILNLIGSLAPEKGVDALGYHLYFPKVYLKSATMMLKARGSRLFSLFPHLGSMIYLLPVSLDLPNVAQVFHFFLGLLTTFVIYLLLKKEKKLVWPAMLIFYSSLVTGSISRSAYSDFFVTYFLSTAILVALGGFKRVNHKLDNSRLGLSGIFLGAVLASKNQSLALIPLFFIHNYFLNKQKSGIKMIELAKIVLIAFLIPLPWYLRSWLIAKNPFYPMFSVLGPRVPQFNLSYYFELKFLSYFDDLITIQPLLIPLFVFALLFFKQKKNKFFVFLAFLVFLYWVFLPRSFHDRRYFLPYLLLITLSSIFIDRKVFEIKIFKLVFWLILFLLLLARAYTNCLYLPYVFGFENKEIYLSNALKDHPEDYYDFQGKFSKVFSQARAIKILTDNTLGLYYLNYPFTEFEDSVFYQKKLSVPGFFSLWKKEKYNFLLIKNEPISQFLDKIGISEQIFRLEAADEPSKTYLYSLNDD